MNRVERCSGRGTDVPGLFFAGFRSPPTGAPREIALQAPRVAAAVRDTLNGL